MSTVLSLKSICKAINGKQILDNVSFDLEKSKFSCIVGPSGCGKSTLLKIISGVEKHDSGQVHINGRDVSALAPLKRNTSIVFQDYSLYPTMTVYDNIALGLKINKLPKAEIEEKVFKTVENLGLTEHLKKYPSQLSGGQQQRVAFARALVMQSDLILLDEPFSAIDAQIKFSMQEDLLQIMQMYSLSILLVTHDLEEALTLGDKVIVMNHGVIEKTGTSEEIYNSTDNDFIRSFVIKQVNNKYSKLKEIVER